MATYRIGIGTEFKLDGGVGIGTDTVSGGLGDLRVDGTTKTTDLDVTGVSTFTRYAGFSADNIEIDQDRDLSLTGEHGSIGDIVVGVNSTFTVSTGATVDVGTVPSVSIGTHFSFPTGGMEDRPEAVHEGMIRFNEEIGTLEFYNGVEWREFKFNVGASGRGVMMGGSEATPSYVYSTYIEYVTISSKGNAQNFGELTDDYAFGSGCSSETRGLHGGGEAPSASASIGYITIASSGNAIDFGNLTATKVGSDALSSSTRGIWVGGSPNPNANIIDFVEIATTGNAVDFGDVNAAKQTQHASFSSPTRGVWGGGEAPGVTARIRSITIASKGNSTDFGGELISAQRRSNNCGCSNSVRGLVFGGYNNGTITINTIQYITIASNGNAQYFGDLSQARESNGSFASQIRGICSGGRYQPNNLSVNTMEFVEISSTGKAMDFGDLSEPNGKVWHSTCSDYHGGLGGY